MVFTSRERKIVSRSHYNRHVWKPALAAAGVESRRANGMHALRHYYASVQLEAGTSVRARWPIASATPTRLHAADYCHLVPTSDERARDAVDAAFRSVESRESRGLFAD